ncbi:MAG: DUF2004 domain-containing protein [Ferruginibacter sp.]
MANFKLSHFGVLDSVALDEYYEVDIDFNNKRIQLDLNFENKAIELERLEMAHRFIENIRIHDLNNKKYIEQDFADEDGDTVGEYLEHHIEELATDELNQLIGYNTKTVDQSKLLLKKLYLTRVGLYPDSKEQFAIFDYTIGPELTDYLVVINTDENGNLDYITMES